MHFKKRLMASVDYNNMLVMPAVDKWLECAKGGETSGISPCVNIRPKRTKSTMTDH